MAAVMVSVMPMAVLLAVAWHARPQRVRDPTAPAATASTSAVAPAGVLVFLEVAAREVRTGSSVAAAVAVAIERAGPDAVDLRAALDPGRVVAPDVASNIASDIALAAHAVRRAALVGHQPAAVFDRAAATLRERAACRDEQRAHTAQARLSARVLTLVPVAFAAFTVATNPSVRRVYLGSSIGAAVIVCGAALNMAGWWWMRRIVHRAAMA